MIGIPTVWPYSGTGVHTHHNSADRPETVDARSLGDLTILGAAYLYYLAAAGDSEGAWLAELALHAGQQQIVTAIGSVLDSFQAPTPRNSRKQCGMARIASSTLKAEPGKRFDPLRGCCRSARRSG